MLERAGYRDWGVRLALLGFLGCSSSHLEDPPPDPALLAAAQAEAARIRAERAAEADARAEQERAVLAILSESADPPRLFREDEVGLILVYYCGDCHGEPPHDSADGIYYIDDIDRWAAEGKVIPGDGEGSRLVLRMREGSMPPITSDAPPMPAATVDRIADYIDSLEDPAPAE